MTFRVARDADLLERHALGGQRPQELGGAPELSARLGTVPPDHEDFAHVVLAEPGDDLGKVVPVGDEPRGQMRHDPESHSGKPPGHLDRAVDPVNRGGGHRQPHVAR